MFEAKRHFGIVDAFISEEKNDNYISFQFKGGAAQIDRRERRARKLAGLRASAVVVAPAGRTKAGRVPFQVPGPLCYVKLPAR